MTNRNLPIDLLRTLITISEVGGHTRAAALLGRTQPAISLQIKRLDEFLGVKCLTQSGQKSVLSDDGQRLAVYARQILRLNDEAVAHFQQNHSTVLYASVCQRIFQLFICRMRFYSLRAKHAALSSKYTVGCRPICLMNSTGESMTLSLPSTQMKTTNICLTTGRSSPYG